MTRRERLERKLEKRQEWAAGRKSKADALRKVDEHLRHDWAFITQPGRIPARERMNRRDERAYEHSKMADHHETKAAGLARQLDRSVFSDDDDAIERLKERIAENERKRDRMKKINAAYRRGDAAALAELGLDLEKLRERVDHQSEGGRLSWLAKPFPSYELINLGARIRSDRKRIEEVKARQARTVAAEDAGGVLVERVGERWCSVTFSEKPDRAILNELKAAGFRWGGGSWTGEYDRLPDAYVE